MPTIGMVKNDVARLLVMEFETDFLEGPDRFPAGDNGKDGHQAAILISTTSGKGMGFF